MEALEITAEGPSGSEERKREAWRANGRNYEHEEQRHL